MNIDCISGKLYTVKCGYNAVQYNIILHTSLQQLRQNINQFEPTKEITYLTLMGELCDVFCANVGENWPCYNSTKLYCVQDIDLHEKKVPSCIHIPHTSTMSPMTQGKLVTSRPSKYQHYWALLIPGRKSYWCWAVYKINAAVRK